MTLSIGVDLAQVRDRTAIACVSSYMADAPASDAGEESSRRRRGPRKVRHHDLTYLEKLRPGLSYPMQAELIVEIAESLATDERPTLWVDATGVGRAVVDLVRLASPFAVKAVTLTSAAEVATHGNSVSLPKSDLVASLEVALSTRRLHAAPDLALRDDLDRELRAFSYELTPTGKTTYEGRGAHDDLVIAVALATWGGSRGGGGENFRSVMADAIAKRDGTAES